MSNTGDNLRKDVSYKSNTNSHTDLVMSMYKSLVQTMQDHFPKADQRLLFDITKYPTAYQDWDGSVVLKFVYPNDNIDLEAKKNWV